jgi:hypothetical protein
LEAQERRLTQEAHPPTSFASTDEEEKATDRTDAAGAADTEATENSYVDLTVVSGYWACLAIALIVVVLAVVRALLVRH